METRKPKYKIGQSYRVSNWTGITEPLKVLDIQMIWHHRIPQRTWGYRMDGDTGLSLLYVPEGYLRN